MNREAIMKILPHRSNMLLLDEAEETEEGFAEGKYRIKETDWFLQGHFPGNPVVPGVILCEIMAQSTCVLLKDLMKDGGKMPMFTEMNNVRFRNPVRPGDLFTTKCRILRAKHPFYFAEGSGYVDGQLCVKGEFSFVVMGE